MHEECKKRLVTSRRSYYSFPPSMKPSRSQLKYNFHYFAVNNHNCALQSAEICHAVQIFSPIRKMPGQTTQISEGALDQNLHLDEQWWLRLQRRVGGCFAQTVKKLLSILPLFHTYWKSAIEIFAYIRNYKGCNYGMIRNG